VFWLRSIRKTVQDRSLVRGPHPSGHPALKNDAGAILNGKN
jgi:hypothetical protein